MKFPPPVACYPAIGNYGEGRKCLPRPSDDIAIARMCAWLKQNNMIGQTTLAGKLTLTPKDEPSTAMIFGAQNGKQVVGVSGSGRTKASL